MKRIGVVDCAFVAALAIPVAALMQALAYIFFVMPLEAAFDFDIYWQWRRYAMWVAYPAVLLAAIVALWQPGTTGGGQP